MISGQNNISHTSKRVVNVLYVDSIVNSHFHYNLIEYFQFFRCSCLNLNLKQIIYTPLLKFSIFIFCIFFISSWNKFIKFTDTPDTIIIITFQLATNEEMTNPLVNPKTQGFNAIPPLPPPPKVMSPRLLISSFSSPSSISSGNSSTCSSPMGMINYSPKHNRGPSSLTVNRNMKNLLLNLEDKKIEDDYSITVTASGNVYKTKTRDSKSTPKLDSASKLSDVNDNITSTTILYKNPMTEECCTPSITKTPMMPPVIDQRFNYSNDSLTSANRNGIVTNANGTITNSSTGATTTSVTNSTITLNSRNSPNPKKSNKFKFPDLPLSHENSNLLRSPLIFSNNDSSSSINDLALKPPPTKLHDQSIDSVNNINLSFNMEHSCHLVILEQSQSIFLEQSDKRRLTLTEHPSIISESNGKNDASLNQHRSIINEQSTIRQSPTSTRQSPRSYEKYLLNQPKRLSTLSHDSSNSSLTNFIQPSRISTISRDSSSNSLTNFIQPNLISICSELSPKSIKSHERDDDNDYENDHDLKRHSSSNYKGHRRRTSLIRTAGPPKQPPPILPNDSQTMLLSPQMNLQPEEEVKLDIPQPQELIHQLQELPPHQHGFKEFPPFIPNSEHEIPPELPEKPDNIVLRKSTRNNDKLKTPDPKSPALGSSSPMDISKSPISAVPTLPEQKETSEKPTTPVLKSTPELKSRRRVRLSPTQLNAKALPPLPPNQAPTLDPKSNVRYFTVPSGQQISQQVAYKYQKQTSEELQESNSLNAYPNGPRNVLNNRIFLFSDPSKSDQDNINDYDLVVNVAKECSNMSKQYKGGEDREYIYIPWSHTSPIAKDLPSIITKIHQYYEAGLKVLIHCQCGVSRSACVVVAYFMFKFNISVNQAYELLKSGTMAPSTDSIIQMVSDRGNKIEACDRICPNMSLIFELMEYGDKLKEGKKSFA